MNAPGGYAGTLLHVDLTSGETYVSPLDPEFARRYLGGSGFGARLFLDELLTQRGAAAVAAGNLPDALSADNPCVLMTGPLTGASMHAVARWTVGTRSPLTGIWGEANVGGYFGAELKAAGYDGLVITGAAPRPTYLAIDDGRVDLRDATPYWGLDTFATEDALVAAHRDAGSSVAVPAAPTTAGTADTDAQGADARTGRPGHVLCIGPAGENLVHFACLVNHRGHVAGRTGLGAVWGAKRLKAIYVRGTQRPAPAHPDRLAALRTELDEVYRENIVIEALKAFGTACQWDIGAVLGDIPMGNWRQGEWERFDDLGPLAYEEKLDPRARGCFACGVRCKRDVEVTGGPFRMERGPGPEYETLAGFGTVCLNSDIEAVAKANDLCNRLGMDTISCSATIAFAMECREAGLLRPEPDVDPDLEWGDGAAIVALVEQIAGRHGLGDMLADGSVRAAERVGGGASAFLTAVKGLESPLHDPRSFHGLGLAYAVAPRGACHLSGVGYWVESGGMYLPEIPELAEGLDGMTSTGKAAAHVAGQDYGVFFAGCAGFCSLGGMVLTATQAVDMVNHVTGFGYDLAEVTALGRRVWYLQRGLSHLFGARATDDRLPTRLATPLADGPAAGSAPDMHLMMDEFYALRGLRPDGIPRRDVLTGLGLDDLADLLGV